MSKRPGRPRKYEGPIRRLNIILPYHISLEMEEEKGDMSWTDYILMLYFEHKQRKLCFEG